ncbi:transcriptional Coactivator p15-domain-containing protein [Usnea florida]
MPKRKPPSTGYESDNGFIVASNDEGGGGGRAKRTKKDNAKGAKGAAKDGDTKGKGKKEGTSGGRGKDGGGEWWELTSKRRVGISEFKGKYMVNIREYYEKDGEVLPGKKGISLPIEQFNTLIKVLPEIEVALAKKNQSVSRPDYSGAGASAAVEDDEEEDDEEMEREGKKNFEETSDEE